jgi:hypothetical protein
MYDLQGEITLCGKKDRESGTQFWAVLVPHSQRLDLYRDRASFLSGKSKRDKALKLAKYAISRDASVVHLVCEKKGLLSSTWLTPTVDLVFESDTKAALWESAMVSTIADHAQGSKSRAARDRFEQYQSLCSSLAALILAVMETGIYAD